MGVLAGWVWHGMASDLTSEDLPVGDVDAAGVGEGEGGRHRSDDVLGGHVTVRASRGRISNSRALPGAALLLSFDL